MPLLVTPRQLVHRAELYHQLAQLADAGLPLFQSLETLLRAPPARSFLKPLSRVLANLTEGATFSDALQALGHWAPSFDIALLRAGEKSGRLPECLKLLAEYYQERARLIRQVISDLMYPLFLFHFAILIAPIPALVSSGDLVDYAKQTLGVFIPIYAVVFFFLYAAQGRHGESWRALIEAVLRRVPLCGSARRSLALARLAGALEALIMAGMSIIEAWELAAAASGSPALRRAVVGWRNEVLNGETPAEAVSRSREFPALFANMYHTGEISGQLDETLIRLRHLYQDEGSRKLRAFSEWTPKLIYFGIMIMIAVRIVSFWSNIYGQGGLLGDALKF